MKTQTSSALAHAQPPPRPLALLNGYCTSLSCSSWGVLPTNYSCKHHDDIDIHTYNFLM